LLDAVQNEAWATDSLVVRSSTLHEDRAGSLTPGRYLSVVGVTTREQLRDAVDSVIDSYRVDVDEHLDQQQVLVQRMVDPATMSGVAFTRDPNTGAPYFVVNYEEDGDCTAVTSGKAADLKTFYLWRHAPTIPTDARLGRVVALAEELTELLQEHSLDIEFAFGGNGELYLLQARPLEVPPLPDAEAQQIALTSIAGKVATANRRHPYLLGDRTAFGVMPDWNPAEIIGTRPRPLALSIYRRLITDSQWAEQRVRYGYRDARGFPLLLDFAGQPYVDFRASCNSLIPADLDEPLADRLVTYYVDRLAANPELHDKVEFEVLFSAYHFTLDDQIREQTHGLFDTDERRRIVDSLRTLTNRLLRTDHGARRADAASIASLHDRLPEIRGSRQDLVGQIYWLLEDCRRYGTLAFAGFARLGFVAVEILRSLVALGVLSQDDETRLMASLDTVTNRMLRNQAELTRDEFLARYGFLRPGTYDICSPSYDEAPDLYFDFSANPATSAPAGEFRLPATTMREIGRLLTEHGLDQDPAGLLAFIADSVVRREESKFEFSRHLSEALSLLKRLGLEVGLNTDDMSYVDVDCVDRLYRGAEEPAAVLHQAVTDGRQKYELTRHLVLPPMIFAPEDVTAFHLPSSEPNYVTQEVVTGPVAVVRPGAAGLRDKILLLPSGDPGYDWIFSQGIAGFVTRFGGANSHMAIRAHQLRLPAVIGAGDVLYNRCRQASSVTLDCLNRRVQVLR
ncbi:MAG TPA: PEP/pyruvate-binding domain-containing protein, partial [Pseudonocardiaceae bacterium]